MSSKYDGKGVFNDPVVRCTECQQIIFREELHAAGCCPKCGNRRVRNVLAFDDKELEYMKAKGIDPDFLAIFNVPVVSNA